MNFNLAPKSRNSGLSETSFALTILDIHNRPEAVVLQFEDVIRMVEWMRRSTTPAYIIVSRNNLLLLLPKYNTPEPPMRLRTRVAVKALPWPVYGWPFHPRKSRPIPRTLSGVYLCARVGQSTE